MRERPNRRRGAGIERCSASIAALAFATISGDAAFAQDETAESARTRGAQTVLGEVVVTARKREEAIQDIPVAVTAVSAQDLERAAITNFEQATALTPGFSVAPSSFTPLAPVLSMRGNSQASVLITDDAAVGIYVDGVFIARPFGIGVDILDLKNVQVLKGPQGTLFGRNSTAGAVLLETNDPRLNDFSGRATATIGPDNTGGSIVLNMPLSERFAIRAAYQRNHRDNYIDNLANDPNNPVYTQYDDPVDGAPKYTPAKTYDTRIGGHDTELWRVKLRWAPTDTVDLVLSHEEFESDVAGPARDQVWFGGALTPQSKSDDTVSLSFDPRSYADTRRPR